MTKFFLSHWLNKKEYIFDKLSITFLWVLLTNYQRYMAFFLGYNLPKIKAKIRPRSTYPKKLNSEARLRNGKVLGTYSAQTESGLLDSHDQCTPLCMIWMICCTWKTKSHQSIYECILFFVKKIQICVVIKKKKLIWFRKIRYVFVYVKKKNSFWQRKVRSVFIK